MKYYFLNNKTMKYYSLKNESSYNIASAQSSDEGLENNGTKYFISITEYVRNILKIKKTEKHPSTRPTNDYTIGLACCVVHILGFKAFCFVGFCFILRNTLSGVWQVIPDNSRIQLSSMNVYLVE